ncbi:hypothetical protein Vadar_022285 [Vaccinium darrowii]|uniref:Uncharacterized protein n=1 Tax=Vaccinium darrowii TaxID=229202 RepID=A0ACB7YPW0_9ERIC|nr:hypothetical protein Vadar_022285 [Vaccinium darrowii]
MSNRTSKNVTNSTVSNVAALGNGHGDFGFDSGTLAVLESITAQRQLGFWHSFFTLRQQPLEGVAFSFIAAGPQGASLKASASGEDFPHSPAPWIPFN